MCLIKYARVTQTAARWGHRSGHTHVFIYISVGGGGDLEDSRLIPESVANNRV